MKKNQGGKAMELLDRYLCSLQRRRDFIKGLSMIAGGAAAATFVIPLLDGARAEAEQIREDDPRLHTHDITYKGATGDIKARLARPKGDAKLPGVIVIHENRGLTPHIADVARRVAIEGFIALAPDALSPLGGTPSDQSKAVTMIGQLDQASTIKNFVAALQYLKTLPSSTGKVGVVGFCWGGGMANQLAVNSLDLSAAVPYYGRQPAVEDVPKIKASLLLQYAATDEMINKGIPDYEAALKKAQIDYKLYIYEGAQHAFNNDTNPERYNKEAADLAWKRTIAFFKEKLKT
jgi:carboxymethylenebutenolidase